MILDNGVGFTDEGRRLYRLERNRRAPVDLSRMDQRRLMPLAAELGKRAGALGRNSPCLCGSGKRLKRCCGGKLPLLKGDEPPRRPVMMGTQDNNKKE